MSGGIPPVGCEHAFEDDRLERYVSGEAAEAERDAFEVHVLDCVACRRALEAHMDLADALRATHPPAGLPAPVAQPPAVGARPARWLPIAAALAAAALVGTVFMRSGPGTMPVPAETPASAAPATPAASVPSRPAGPALEKPEVTVSADRALRVRGSGDDSFLEDFGAAIEPYRNDDYARAAERLAAVARRHPAAPEPHFYRGVSLLFQGRSAEAVPALERAAELAQGPQRDGAEWYLALALVRTDQRAKALTRFEALCAREGTRRDAACAAIGTLRGSTS
jgi:tetratricopeptide (TPR) repeat protein